MSNLRHPVAAAIAFALAAPALLYATGFFEQGETMRLKTLVAGFRRGAIAPAEAGGGE
jgi:hypothetical protein